MSEVVYKEFRIGDLFEIASPQKRFNANAIQIYDKQVTGSHPYVVRTSQNNGQRGYIIQDEKYLSPANTFSFGQDTATVFFQTEPYFTGDKIKIMSLKDKSVELSEKSACYLMKLLRTSFSNYSWGQSSFNEEILCNTAINLPVSLNNTPDYEYMEKYISALKQERISALERYLIETGLNDCELTDEDKNILLEAKETKEFRLGDLFEKLQTPYLGKGVKAQNVSKVKTQDFCVPIVYAKSGDNGIMYWAQKGDFTTFSKVISIVYNGAIAAGLVYAQEEPTGILAESYMIKVKNQDVSHRTNLYLKTAIQKVIYPLYSREHLATWNNKVENDIITLPVASSGEPDYEYMEKYIRVQEKLAIKDIVAYVEYSKSLTYFNSI